jgi:hypothetical protein
LLLVAALMAVPSFAQTTAAAAKPVDNMQILREKLQGDKKLVVAANMDLTEAEAKAFWPLYEAYQQELHKINDRIAMTIVDYAKEFNANTLTDAKAAQLLERSLAIEEYRDQAQENVCAQARQGVARPQGRALYPDREQGCARS